jgi:DNA-directed RNA polymerase specialized sigma24 family protein
VNFSGLCRKSAAGSARDYATEADFCQLFREQMNRFYFLSLLLTADAGKAEQCFVTSLEACINSRRIFQDWAQRWATHTIIKTAIQIVSPSQLKPNAESLVRSNEEAFGSGAEALLAALQAVPTLDRFVHHMTVVERYSDLECSTFLGCTPKDVRQSRERALQRLGSNEGLAQLVTEFDPIVAKAFISSMVERAIQIEQ